tara:strand:- start:154 stop:321 length:168 start_codon:yes stop_codon:yes gene_type:complete
VYNKEVSNPDYKMAKTRKITATFEDGTTIQRTTSRIYTHAVKTIMENLLGVVALI